jgi:hypothetical protein
MSSAPLSSAKLLRQEGKKRKAGCRHKAVCVSTVVSVAATVGGEATYRVGKQGMLLFKPGKNGITSGWTGPRPKKR